MQVGLIPALGLTGAALSLAIATPATLDPPMKFVAPLSGTAEVPGPGDTDGKGIARLTFRPEANEVCFEIHTTGLDKPTEAHVHTGAPGTEGAVVLSLTRNLEREQSGCAKADGKLLRQIATNPAAYYVNVHSDEFKKGAVRGQLQPEGVGADTVGMSMKKPAEKPDSVPRWESKVESPKSRVESRESKKPAGAA